jgi:ribonuclease PH
MTRIDKRSFDQLRKVTMQTGVNMHAEGSCLITMGDTQVMCTATIEDRVPMFLKGQGTGWLTAEYGMLPRSCADRIQRDKKSGRTFEIQRLIGRALRSVVDIEAIGERTITIDCDVLQADGGTRTASINGGFIAMVLALKKLCDAGRIKEIPVSDYCAAISVGIFEGALVLDLNYHEDSQAEVDMNVVKLTGDKFVEIQGTGEHGTFSKALYDGMIALAAKGIDQIMAEQRKYVRDILLK